MVGVLAERQICATQVQTIVTQKTKRVQITEVLYAALLWHSYVRNHYSSLMSVCVDSLSR